MLQQLLGLFKDRREIFDLTTLEDPIALKTRWSPLEAGGNSFCTHRLLSKQGRLHINNPNSALQMQVTLAANLFCFFFIGLGLVITGVVMDFINDPSVVSSGNLPPELASIIPLFFSVFGAGFLWRLHQKNVIFNKKEGIYISQRRSFPLNDVHAIQLIREYVAGSKHSYYSYEMNLVLHNGERFNITDHGSLHAIRFDAEKLANYLNIPVWDMIDFQLK